MIFLEEVERLSREGRIPKKFSGILCSFYASYSRVLQNYGKDITSYKDLFSTFLKIVLEQLSSPYSFEPYHSKVTQPFDYYSFGNDFLRPLIQLEESQVMGTTHFDGVQDILSKGENVVFLANHQTEADPQLMTILLEKNAYTFGQDIIYVAGERVLTDPLAAPFSRGRNLLCIFSKRHIENPPEQKVEKQKHNKKTLAAMQSLLNEGAKVIYVAPSGGRDRQNTEGKIEVAPFDPQSVELFSLIAKKSTTKTHFFPLALHTYHILPPPDSIGGDLGEHRETKGGRAHLALGQEILFNDIAPGEEIDKWERRDRQAKHCWSLVRGLYVRLEKL